MFVLEFLAPQGTSKSREVKVAIFGEENSSRAVYLVLLFYLTWLQLLLDPWNHLVAKYGISSPNLISIYFVQRIRNPDGGAK